MTDQNWLCGPWRRRPQAGPTALASSGALRGPRAEQGAPGPSHLRRALSGNVQCVSAKSGLGLAWCRPCPGGPHGHGLPASKSPPQPQGQACGLLAPPSLSPGAPRGPVWSVLPPGWCPLSLQARCVRATDPHPTSWPWCPGEVRDRRTGARLCTHTALAFSMASRLV